MQKENGLIKILGNDTANNYDFKQNVAVVFDDLFFVDDWNIDEVIGMSSKELVLKLLETNILVKDCSEKFAFDKKNYIRIAIRNEHDNNKIIKSLTGIEN